MSNSVPMDYNLPGSPVPGILQARILERVAMPFSRGSSDPGIKLASLMSPALAGGFFTTEPPGKPHPSLGPFKFQAKIFSRCWVKLRSSEPAGDGATSLPGERQAPAQENKDAGGREALWGLGKLEVQQCLLPLGSLIPSAQLNFHHV